MGIEHGRSRAELGLVLRTLSALDLSLKIDAGNRLTIDESIGVKEELELSLTNDTDDRRRRSSDDITPADIDAVVRAATGDRK